MFKFTKILAILALFAAISSAGPVSMWGALKACKDSRGKGRLCASNGAWNNVPVMVRGVSLGWSNTGWESADFFNATTVNAMVDGWKVEVIRVPLGYSEDGGYSGDATNWTRAKAAIDAAIAKDVYVVIDWHSHNAQNETNAAKTFFETTVADYHNKEHVIFEIYNEPKGVNWNGIKTYADAIIKAIRDKGANNLILVGTPEMSLRPGEAVKNLLSDNNVGYVFHFYADTHEYGKGEFDGYPAYTTGVANVLNAGKPVFVTEWGTTDADGGDDGKGHFSTHNATQSESWFTYMDNNMISSCAWNVNRKKEGSAFFGINGSFSQSPTTNFTSTSLMTASGQYIYNKIKSYESNAPWKSSTPPSSSSTTETLIDDFEDEDGFANFYEPWYIYDDSEDQNGVGESTSENAKDEDGNYIVVVRDGSDMVALLKNYTLRKGGNKYAPYMAIGLDTKNNQKLAAQGGYDLSKCTGGFSYRYKGVAHNFKIQQSDVKDFGYHAVAVTPASNTEWKSVSFILDDFVQPLEWADEVKFDLKKVEGFSWEVKGGDTLGTAGLSGLTGSLAIDDFTCLGTMPLPPPPEGSSSSSKGGSSSSNAGGSSSSGSVTPITVHRIAHTNALNAMQNSVNLQSTGNATLQVFDLKGVRVRTFKFGQGSYFVPLADLPKGLYIVKANNGSWKRTIKITVK